MVTQRKNIFWTLLLLLEYLVLANSYSIHSTGIDNSVDYNYSTGPQHITIHNFSPRLDNNNAWRPVGRGDPLKNDPTYDYSPPTLDRVRYWAETNNSVSEKNYKEVKVNTPETYVVADRIGNVGFIRKAATTERIYNSNSMQKNAKGEVPLLQPKYMAMRRNYYAQAPPTHLLPPPMQNNAGMKLNMHEYNHNVHNYMPNSTVSYMKHTPSTSSWSGRPQSTSYDSHFQESVNYMQFARPSTMSPSQMFSANSIRSPANALKQNSPPRKPWLHELLQKEFVKTSKPIGISTTFAPMIIPTTTPTTSTSTTTTTTAATTTSRDQTWSTTVANQNMNFMSTLSTTALPLTRLLIPNTNNLQQRPTVAPLRMTTDSLFKNYNQANLPLTGPMYLIIEGHSKVKTYGKDELDPHKPKIVPVISKREPVVRIADPNEKRGTIETFQVKHLHTNSYKTTTPVAIKKSTETTTEFPSNSTTTTIMPMAKLNEKNTSITFNNTTMPEENSSMQNGAQSLLNLLDSFFGVSETTTIASTKLQMITMNSTESAENLTTENALRGVRQVFDYDQLPELRLKETDLQNENSTNDDNDTISEESDELHDIDEKNTESAEEASNEQLIERIDSLIKDVEVESAQDELDDLLSMEDESVALSMSRKA